MLNGKPEWFRPCLSARQELSQPASSARSHWACAFPSAADLVPRQRLHSSAKPDLQNANVMSKKLKTRLLQIDKVPLARFCTLSWIFLSGICIITLRPLCETLGLKDSSVNVQTSHHNKQFDTLVRADWTHCGNNNRLVCLVKDVQLVRTS